MAKLFSREMVRETLSMMKTWSKNRFILFIFFVIIFLSTNYIFTGNFFPSTDTKDLWFYSGIFMVLFSVLFIEPYYTSPKNVITNTIPLLLVFLSVKNTFENSTIWWITVTVILILLVLSIIAISIEDNNQSQNHLKNKISNTLKKIVILVGKGKIIYSATFLIFLYVNITSKPTIDFQKIFDSYFVTILCIWGLILSIDPKEVTNTFSKKKNLLDIDAIGEIFGVQSGKIFLVKLFGDKNNITRFKVVKFKYLMQDSEETAITGIIFDTYLLNQERWVKVLQLGNLTTSTSTKLEKNIVYVVSNIKEKTSLNKQLRTKDLTGIVIEGSHIGKIKFEYSKQKDDLQEGDLLELTINDKRLFYQVIDGLTEKESLENRNETGYIKGEAIQLGEWCNDKLSFQKFGWVPSINTPIFKANTTNINVEEFSYPLFKLGTIPGTSLPSIINLNDAVSHHIALMGITGSGKSFLTYEIIKELLTDTKIICIDFTGEWKKKIETTIKQMITRQNVTSYLASMEKKIGLFELPDMSNTTDVLRETQLFLESVFNYAKTQYDNNTPVKIALVLEEAHTITPETSFLGDLGDYGGNKALVNKMTQIALQGRKYGVGLIVIAQRTANVSKTVLTQCNTVVCFQAFDETSFTFLGNYVGNDMVKALPNLKQYHAVVAGKAVKSNMPMIVDLKR